MGNREGFFYEVFHIGVTILINAWLWLYPNSRNLVKRICRLPSPELKKKKALSFIVRLEVIRFQISLLESGERPYFDVHGIGWTQGACD
ncbi:hypothetical protein MRB53_012532 [Persea americana]|uniref:Uncharacterized protein n=1 Tax=Persea americana TaxID=3435 RepID=A0ACC2LXX5_PERAE|nr:hypothetical protein MRB53_012532 [Persea americana]